MEYAVVLYFDEETEEKLSSLIRNVSEESGNKYMVVNEIPPHLTISFFQYNGNVESVIENIEKNISVINIGNIVLASIGIFNPNVLFLSPIVNTYLLRLNKKITEIIKINDKIILNKNYIENQWVPHISLGVKLNEDEIKNGVKILLKNYTVIDAKIKGIGLSECNPYKDIKIWKIK